MSTTLKPRIATVVLYQGDDQERINDLAERAKRAKALDAVQVRDLSETTEWATLAQEHDALVEAAKKRAVKVVMRALGRKQWRSLVAEHPPREGHEGDKLVGVNEETFQEPLVQVSIASPLFKTPADRDDFLDAISDYQFELLYLNAFALNRALGVDPKADLHSQLNLS
jgi:uncharacterized iron-regulated protein